MVEATASEEVEDLKQQEPTSPEHSTSESLGQSSAPEGSGSAAEPSVTDSGATAEAKSEPVTPSTPTIRVTPSDPWSSFSLTNAWDEVPGIERYVDAIPWHRRTKSGGARPSGGLRLGNLVDTDVAASTVISLIATSTTQSSKEQGPVCQYHGVPVCQIERVLLSLEYRY